MKQCPQCKQFTEDENDFCPNDGTRLAYDSRSEPTIFLNTPVSGQIPQPVPPSKPNYLLYVVILLLAIAATGFAVAFFMNKEPQVAKNVVVNTSTPTPTPQPTPSSTPTPTPAPPPLSPVVIQRFIAPSIGVTAVIKTDDVLFRSAPSLNPGNIIGKMRPGQSVTILEYSQQEVTFKRMKAPFARVRTDDGAEGWVFAGFLK